MRYGGTAGGYTHINLKFILDSNNLLIDIIKPYRYKLFTKFKWKEDIQRVKDAKIEKELKEREATGYKQLTFSEWLINYNSQPEPNFHTY